MDYANKLVIDITSTALAKCGADKWMRQAAELAEQHGAILGVQVHNSARQPELERAVACGFPLSFHSPVMGKYMMNFAAENADVSWAMAAEQADLMKKHLVSRSVFHAALMTDKPIYAFGHGMSYHECMMQANRPELLRNAPAPFIRDYTDTDEYSMRLERLKNNLAELKKRYPEFLWCVENDFPGHVAGVLRGRDLAYLEHAVCFDTGHMWAASKMLDLDFYEEFNTALASGYVKMIHLHASKYTFDMPHENWGDGHLPLNHKTAMDIPYIIRRCRECNVRHIVLEIGDASLEDVKTVLHYYTEEQ